MYAKDNEEEKKSKKVIRQIYTSSRKVVQDGLINTYVEVSEE